MRDALAVAMDTEVQLEAMETPKGKTVGDIARPRSLGATRALEEARTPQTAPARSGTLGPSNRFSMAGGLLRRLREQLRAIADR